jgi:hypothetical protein
MSNPAVWNAAPVVVGCVPIVVLSFDAALVSAEPDPSFVSSTVVGCFVLGASSSVVVAVVIVGVVIVVVLVFVVVV